MTKPTTLYVMRHGQTSYNILGLCNDDPTVDVRLTPEGIQQAESAARSFAQVPIETIFVSQLPRTRQTAEIINRHHNVPIITNALLNDIRSGFDSRPVSEYFAVTGHDRYHITPSGGESVREFQLRVLKFLHELKPLRDTTILVVSHEETLRVFTAYFNDLTTEEMLGLNFGNCEFVKFSM